jgi:oligopeptide transport system permease protein
MLFSSKDRGVAELADGLAHEGDDGRSLWRDAFRRFRSHKAALASLVILLVLVLFSVFGHLLSPWNNESIDWESLTNLSELGAPSLGSQHYFGLDAVGRDLYQRTVQGSRISLMVGALGALVAVVIGTIYGAISGYVGGRTDSAMMRTLDVLSAFPFMFLVIVLMAVFGRNVLLIFVAIGAVSWLNMARIVRGQTLSLKRKEYIEAAVATGVHPLVIVLRHIVPNVLGVVIVYATLLVPEMIMFESFISFLGLGVSEPYTSWGALISDGADTMRTAPWALFFPMSMLVITLFCFNFLGDGLRDALDPKDR